MIGTTIDNYRIVARLGEGGMGTVYRATDVMLERDVALKVLRPELADRSDLVDRFRAEAVTLARLSHPNVAAVHGLLRVGRELIIVMEFVDGETLETRLRREGRLPVRSAVAITGMVLDALDYAHHRGVVHRDIKSANIMVQPDGVAKVMDFGIARVLGGERRTRTGFIVGTLHYMAPEQIKGQPVDHRTDLYAVGILCYEMLTGRVPFDADSEWAIMQAHLEHLPEPPRHHADVPPALDAIVLRALAKAPDDRPQSAHELKLALDEATRALTAPAALPPTRVAKAGPHDTGHLAPGPVPAQVPPTRVADGPASPWPTPPPPTRLTEPPSKATTAPTARDGQQPAPDRAPVTWRHVAGAIAVLVMLATLVVVWVTARRVGEVTVAPGAESTAGSADVAPASAPGDTVLALPVEPSPGFAWPRDAVDRPTPVESPVVTPRESPPPSLPSPGPSRPPSATPSPPLGPPSGSPAVPPVALPVEGAATPVEPAPADTRPSEPEAPAVTPIGPARRRAAVEPVVFDRVKWLEQRADGKAREVDALLELRGDELVVLARQTRAPLKTFRYETITAATYSQSKHPRWKTGAGAAVVVGVFAAPIFFMKGTKHWLTIQTADDFAVLRLDKNNCRLVIPAFESRSGLEIEQEPPEG